MSSQKRRYLIAGNWKMNNTVSEARELVQPIVNEVGQQTEVHVAVCPPFTALSSVAELVGFSNVHLGAQNMHPEASGAYTGEISAGMLRELFVSHVILGHSERREYFGETDAFVNSKVRVALEHTLRPILCVGESLEERSAGKTLEVVNRQIREGLKDVPADKADHVVIAYEPIWAIGTGKVATPEMAQEVHGEIRARLEELFGSNVGGGIRILYGGSMKPANAAELLAQPDIDGGLIGGASLDAKSFIKLVEHALAQE